MRTLSLVVVGLLGLVGPLGALDTYRIPRQESTLDRRTEYPEVLLRQVLRVTEAEYGPATLEVSPRVITRDRQLDLLQEGKELQIDWAIAQPSWDAKTLVVRIPLKKGIESYRFFLIRKDTQSQLRQVRTLADLTAFRIGSGDQWSTTKALRAAGLNLVTGANYEGLFEMLMAGRFDLFQRGLDEAWKEVALRGDKFPDLAVESDLALYVPSSNFYYVAPQLPKVAERIRKGLVRMIDDGSFDKLFLEYFGEDLRVANLASRRLIVLPNTLLSPETPFDVERYWFRPKTP